jgi:predicted unusual protein kinase regulating ubiquinone biosynthesis (AarF/ABC1/UbiB family)
MGININDLVNALPLEEEAQDTPQQALQQLIQKLAHKSVPTGAFNRLWVLGTLQAKIAAAYLVHWVRSSFAAEDEKQRQRNETHLKAAVKLLGGMSYLRGAIMKLGQVLANYPDVVPEEFSDVLGRLHFEAPPMHFSLLRELFRKEIGSNPEEVFDDFETEAFAAASLGQVHRARLKGSGHQVAVKIQYPNIARTIRDDFRNMQAIVFPMRITSDWDNLKEQFEEIRHMLDMEVDYEQEARSMDLAQDAFTEAEGIVVPRVYHDYSSKRVLTMDYIDGVHLDRYLATDPSQEERDAHGHKMILSSFRLSYGRHLLHADPHPGNYFFMPDGRMGLIDFGCCCIYTEDEIDYMSECERAIHGTEEQLRKSMARAGNLTAKQAADEERLAVMKEWCDWVWAPMRHEGPFDFGDPDYFKHGPEIYGKLVRRRYVRSQPLNIWLSKTFVGVRALLNRLKARVDMRALWQQETYVK